MKRSSTLTTFRTVCAHAFSGYFHVPLWERIVLRLTHAEPASRIAATAVGALYQCQVGLSLEEEEKQRRIGFAKGQYVRAIQTLNQGLDDSVRSLELAIITGVLLMVFEVLQMDNRCAMIHHDGGLAILKTLHRRLSNSDLKELVQAFSRFYSQTSTFAVQFEATFVQEPIVLQDFQDISDARRTLDLIVSDMYSRLKAYGLRHKVLPGSLPPPVTKDVSHVQDLLRGWHSRFERYTERADVGVKILLIQYAVAWITMLPYGGPLLLVVRSGHTGYYIHDNRKLRAKHHSHP